MKTISRSKHDKNNEYEQLDSSFIERCPHDPEHPYLQISRDFLRNPDLSPFCRWLISYLLTFDKTWKIKISYICKTQRVSKETLWKYFNEAIEAGYIKRQESIVKGLKRYNYLVSEWGSFKKSLPCTEKPCMEKPCTNKKEQYTEKQSSSLRSEEYNSPYPRSGRKESKKKTPRQQGTNPRAKKTNPRAMGTNPRADIPKNKELAKKIERCVISQVRIPVKFYYNSTNLCIQLTTKGTEKIVRWNQRKEDFKEDLKCVLESYGFDTSLPPKTGFVKSYPKDE